ncbi:unnamed protein product [Chrysoparadoxa australica]
MGCYQAYNKSVHHTFQAYGRLAAKVPSLILLVGLALVAILSAGLYKAELANDLFSLWMYRSERLDSELSFFREHFGGMTRSQNILTTDAEGGNSATIAGLEAQLAALPKAAEASYTHDGQDFALDDLCERSTVPAVFRPFPVGPVPNGFEYIAAGSWMSYGFQFMTQCLVNAGGVAFSPGINQPIPAPTTPLPYGWGIDQFPCTRTTVLDCFAEGDYDYPTALKEVDQWSRYIMFNSMRDTCLQGFEAEQTAKLTGAAIQAGADPLDPVTGATAAGQAEALTTNLDQTLQLMWTWGYHSKIPFRALDDESLMGYLNGALQTTANPEVTAAACNLGVPGTPEFGQPLPCCLNWSGIKMDPNTFFSGMNVDETMGLTRVDNLLSSLRTFHQNSPTLEDRLAAQGVTEAADREAITLGWEKSYIDTLLPLVETEMVPGIQIDIFSERSDDDMVADGNQVEPRLVVLAYVMMAAYVLLSMVSWSSSAKSNLVYSRTLLSLGGVVIVGLSTMASFGLVSYFGMQLSPINTSAVPFLALGLGIDDMLVLSYTLSKAADLAHDPSTRLSHTLAHAGASVMVTSICNLACFLLVAIVPISVIKYFGLQMAVTIILNFVFLFLLYVPLMYWDCKRTAASRADVFPCITVTDNVLPEVELEKSNKVNSFVDHIYGPLLLNKVTKAIVILSSLVLTAVLIWYGIDNRETGVGLTDLSEEGSYQNGFLSKIEYKYGAGAAVLVTKGDPEGVSYPEYQQTLLDVQESVQANKYVSSTLPLRATSWLADGTSSLLFLASGGAAPTTPLPAQAFYPAWMEWMAQTGITRASSFVCVDTATDLRVDCATPTPTTVIRASIQEVLLLDQLGTDSVVDAYKTLRADVDSVTTDGQTYIFSNTFVIDSQYEYTWQSFGTILGASAAAVIILITILEGSFQLALITAGIIIMVVCQVFGLMPAIDVKINSGSIVNLSIMIGLAVEFTAHIGRAFLFASGSKNERATEALNQYLYPTFAGAMTTFLAVLPLNWAQINLFQNYYFQTYALMLLLGVFSGVILLPAVLSVIGPAPQKFDGADDMVSPYLPSYIMIVVPAFFKSLHVTMLEFRLSLTLLSPLCLPTFRSCQSLLMRQSRLVQFPLSSVCRGGWH